jgi:hypothetical protein
MIGMKKGDPWPPFIRAEGQQAEDLPFKVNM